MAKERSYPNSETIQPRYAAWLGSLGLPISEASIKEAHRLFGGNISANVRFMEWIRRCKESAPVEILPRGRIVDHDAFTEHCWREAFADVQRQAA